LKALPVKMSSAMMIMITQFCQVENFGKTERAY